MVLIQDKIMLHQIANKVFNGFMGLNLFTLAIGTTDPNYMNSALQWIQIISALVAMLWVILNWTHKKKMQKMEEEQKKIDIEKGNLEAQALRLQNQILKNKSR
jgi:hypothetical protein